MPAMHFSSVLLPLPFTPRDAEELPGRDRERHVVERMEALVSDPPARVQCTLP